MQHKSSFDQMMQHNGDWAYGPLMKSCSICSITTQVLAATFPEKSQVVHSCTVLLTRLLTRSLLVQVIAYYGQTICQKVYWIRIAD